MLEQKQKHINSILAVAGVEPISIEAEDKIGLVVRINAEDNIRALEALRDSDLKFEMLMDTFGADLAEESQIEVTYHLRSFTENDDIRIKYRLEYEGTLISASQVFTSGLMAERELAEMFGLYLEGHPNPKRLLTTESYLNPLLKSTPIRTKEEIWKRFK